MKYYKRYFERLSGHLSEIDEKLLVETAAMIESIKSTPNKVILAGNGGSAAMASHVSVDLTKNAGIRAINFNEADLITCFGNDYGYERWVERAIGFYAQKGDLVIMISSSGSSENIINGALKAKEMGLKLVTLSGFDKDNPLSKIGDVSLWVDSESYNYVEITHQVWLLAIVDKLCGIELTSK